MTTKATDSHTRAPLRSTYQRIVEEIRTGVLLPGDRLIETELAERLGTSRTPVREAIRQLEADALVVHLPRIGSTLRELDHAETSELYEMRAVLEGTAARFAARAASDVELAALAELHRNMTQTDDFDDLSRLNRQFHDALLDAARNRFLIRSTQSISKTFLILGSSTLTQEERAQAANEEHRLILSALQSRDPEQAELAMRAHIEAAHHARLRQIRANEQAGNNSLPL